MYSYFKGIIEVKTLEARSSEVSHFTLSLKLFHGLGSRSRGRFRWNIRTLGNMILHMGKMENSCGESF